MLRKWSKRAALAALFSVIVLAGACSQLGTGLGGSTSGSINDPASAARYLPNLPGYITTDAGNISSALTAVGAPANLLSGNAAAAALIAQIDGLVGCYQGVGALAAKVYVQADVGQIAQGNIPRAGAMAVINQDRIVNNFVPCALGGGGAEMRSFAEQVQPCSSSGSFAVNNETLYYVYAATNPDLCALFQAAIPR
ncbi:MAG: hypothetical protein SF162_10480 [bacterium]|nr:hypothetical protein [bacterium]